MNFYYSDINSMKKYLFLIVISFFACLFGGSNARANVSSLLAQQINTLLDTSRYSVLDEYPFVIISDYSVTEAPELSDSLFNMLSVGVRFKVNRTDIDRQSDFFRTYRHLLPSLLKKGYQMRSLFIRGAASPEGSYANNKRLGRERTANLSQMITDDLSKGPFAGHDIVLESKSITEDYGYLVTLMRKRNDKDYLRVKRVVDESNGDEQACKRILSTMDGGRLWSRLYREYFPELRTARIVLWLTKPAPVIDKIAVSGNVEIEKPAELPTVEIAAEMRPAVAVSQTVEEMEERRHLLAVRTNLLHDFFYMPQYGMAYSPNLQLEYYPLDGHYTYNIGVTWGTNRSWSRQEFFQWRDVQLELRRYFKGEGRFIGTYLGAYAQGGKFGIGLDRKKGWQGEGGGAGLSIGYVLPLTKQGNFRLEFMLAGGVYITRYDPYVYGNPITGEIDGDYYYDYTGSASNFKRRNHRFQWFGPTNAGIQLTYDIIYRKKKPAKKGGCL